jgi:hypothetical protein
MMEKYQFGERPDANNEMEIRKAAGVEAVEDLKLDRALTDFRASVHAWSDAVYTRPRSLDMTVRQRSWRLAAGWALGCLLMAGGVSGALVQREHQQQAARIAAAELQAKQQQAAEARKLVRQEDRNLMAKVDNDTAQEVPTAMEPLAQLMEEGQTQ